MKNLVTLFVAIGLLQTFNLQAQENVSAYANYDFIPGDKVLFEDHFTNSPKGEFPDLWTLEAGQALVSEQNGKLFMTITDGIYGRVAPNMKTNKYLGDNFTVEFDYITVDQRYPILFLTDAEEERKELHFFNHVYSGYFETDLKGTMVFDESDRSLHHAAMVFKNGQIKCYIDEVRSLVIPNTKFKPLRLELGGIGSFEGTTVFTNVRIAQGGDMNLWNKLSKDGKIVTYGIYFDVNKSLLKPNSMGVLNEISKMMKEHPELKIEIGGHTDSDRSDTDNITLSQKRAEAVKAQLLQMGIASERLTTKGYGESKPISDNNTQQGKANNRRVEFVKK